MPVKRQCTMLRKFSAMEGVFTRRASSAVSAKLKPCNSAISTTASILPLVLLASKKIRNEDAHTCSTCLLIVHLEQVLRQPKQCKGW